MPFNAKPLKYLNQTKHAQKNANSQEKNIQNNEWIVRTRVYAIWQNRTLTNWFRLKILMMLFHTYHIQMYGSESCIFDDWNYGFSCVSHFGFGQPSGFGSVKLSGKVCEHFSQIVRWIQKLSLMVMRWNNDLNMVNVLGRR